MLEAVRKEKARYESAAKLAELLIPYDVSWKNTNAKGDRGKPKTHRYGPRASLNEKGSGRHGLQSGLSLGKEENENPHRWSRESNKLFTERGEEELGDEPLEDYTTPIIKTGETPLFLATMSGIREIVEQILDVHPQAIEHINNKGRNILHLAIKYRQIEIFDLVVSNEMLARRLIAETDKWGNSLLHMAGKKSSACMAEKIQSPALQLQKELLLLEVRFNQSIQLSFLKTQIRSISFMLPHKKRVKPNTKRPNVKSTSTYMLNLYPYNNTLKLNYVCSV